MQYVGYLVLILLTLSGCFTRTSSLPVFVSLPEPDVKLESLPAALRGNYAYKIYFTAIAPDGGKIKSIDVLLSKGHGEFKSISNLKFGADYFIWQTPREDIAVAQLKVEAKNSVGQAKAVLSNEFEVRASPPRLLIDSTSQFYSTTNQTVISGSCEDGAVVQVSQSSGETAVFDSVTSCVNNRFSLTVSGGDEGSKEFVVRQTNSVGYETEIPVTWTIDGTAPVIGSYIVNNGDGESASNYLPVSLSASDERTSITAFCVKYNFSNSPALNDECWETPQSLDHSKVTGQTLDFSNYFKRVGYGKATYQVNAWVRDAAGNISPMASNGVLFKPNDPPSVIDVFASTSVTEGLPTREQTLINENLPVNIQWKATTSTEFAKITLYVTYDGVTYSLIQKDLPNARSGFCSGFTNATGCFTWTSPANVNGSPRFFRIRVAATDSVGATSFAVSNLVNSKNMNLLAGNTELGLEGTATAAIFTPAGPHSLAVHPDGRIFVLDLRGLMMVSPVDGIQKLLVPRTIEAAPKDGEVMLDSLAGCPSTCATLRNPTYLALEFNTNNLLIFDADRIRRVNTSANPMTVQTIIGTGTNDDMDNPVDPLSLKMHNMTYADYSFLAPLPNGDIYFFAENFRYSPAKGAVLRHYVASENKVRTIKFSGVAPLLGNSEVTTELCLLARSQILFNPSTSEISRFMNLYSATSLKNEVAEGAANCAYYNPLNQNLTFTSFQDYAFIDPATFLPTGEAAPIGMSPPLQDRKFWNELAFKYTQGMDGRLYAHGYAQEQNRGMKQIYAYDEVNNAWILKVGEGYGGICADGKAANDADCKVEPSSLFVDKNHSIYFIDKNQVRVIQDDGTLLTLAGAPRASKDNGTVSPLDMRFSAITDIRRYHAEGADRFVVLDFTGFKISEFGENTKVTNVAGNGSEIKVSDVPRGPSVAADKPLSWGADGPAPHMAVNPVNGDVYTMRVQGLAPYRIRRDPDTGIRMWEEMGPDTNLYYGPYVHGFHDGKVLATAYGWCNSRSDLPTTGGQCNGRLLQFEGGAPGTKIMGTAGDTTSLLPNFCDHDQNLLDCGGVGGMNIYGLSSSQFEAGGWLIKKITGSETRIMKVVPGAAKIEEFTRLAKDQAGGFAYDPGQQHVYYCSTGGKIYRHKVMTPNPTVDEPVDLPSSKFLCNPMGKMLYASDRGTNGSIIFDFTVAGRPAIAEYLIPAP